MPWRSLPALIGLTRCAARGYPYRNHNVGQDVAGDIDLGLPVVDDITSVGESPAPQQDEKDVKCLRKPLHLVVSSPASVFCSQSPNDPGIELEALFEQLSFPNSLRPVTFSCLCLSDV